MKVAWMIVVVGVVACKGKDGADNSAPTNGAPPVPSSGGPPPTKASVVSGELAVSGAMAGTFHWTPESNLTCTWIPNLKSGGLDVTMTDGKGTFIAFEEHVGTPPGGRNDVIFTSGGLKSASMLKGTTGFTMSGSDDRTRMSVTVDADVASAEGTKVHITGKLELACPP
jgi:hypothetical protein